MHAMNSDHARASAARRVGATIATTAVAGVLAALPTSAAFAAPVGCTDAFYFATANTVTERAADGTLTPLSTGGLDPWTIALNPVDGGLYAFPNDQPNGNHLHVVEDDGSTSDLGAVAGLPAGALYSLGAFDPEGTLWTASPSLLYSIDVDTMTATSVPLTQQLLSDFAYIDGALYAQTGSPIGPDLARVDPATGTVTVIDVPGMTLGTSVLTVDGHLYVSQGTSIAEVLGYDTATPSLVTVATGLGSTPRDGASCPTAPSPFLAAHDDDFTATPVTAEAGGSVGVVLGNDRVRGAAVDGAAVTLAVVDDGGIAGVTLGGDGTLTVPAGTAAGTYSVTYRLCDSATPQLCDTAVVTIRVTTGAQPAAPEGAEPALPATGAEIGWTTVLAGLLLATGGAVALRAARIRRSN